jgi:hypothetical protein
LPLVGSKTDALRGTAHRARLAGQFSLSCAIVVVSPLILTSRVYFRESIVSEPSRLLERIRAEYASVPGLKITCAQAARLWSAPDAECAAAFETLVAEGILWLAPSGRYVALPSPERAAIKGTSSSLRCPHCQKRNAFQRDATIRGRQLTVSLRCVACQRVFSFSAVAA